MGSEQISLTSATQQITTQQQPDPVKQIPETKWTTEELKPVISEITRVVKQEKVTKVEELAPTPTIKFYQVTVDTPKGS